MAEKKNQVAKETATEPKVKKAAAPKATKKAADGELLEVKTIKKIVTTVVTEEIVPLDGTVVKKPAAKKAAAPKKAAEPKAEKAPAKKAAPKKAAEPKAEKAEKAPAKKAAAPKKAAEPKAEKAPAKKAAPKKVAEPIASVVVEPIMASTASAMASDDNKTSTTPEAEKAPAAAAPKAEKAAPKKEEPKKEAPAAPKAEPKKAEKKAAPAASSSPNRLKVKYDSEVVPALMKDRGYKNVCQVPRLDKIVLNMRLGDVKDNNKNLNQAVKEFEAIAGQKAVLTKAKVSVANFKVREGMTLGAKVTLRGKRMYEFYDKLVSIVLPRVRDFRGVSDKSFDGRGNYAMGVKEHIIFPEISYDQVEKIRGFDIAVITSANTDDEAKALLTKLGMPFRN